MSHVQSDTSLSTIRRALLGAIGVAIMAAGLTACGDSAEKKEAESLFIMAEGAAEQGDYNRSIALLDSLDSIYPKQIEVRRKALHLRSRSIEGSTLKAIEENERRLALAQHRGDSMQQYITKVDHPLEPYFVAADMAGKSVVGSNGIEARMMPDGTLYLISSLRSPLVGHSSVTAISGGEESTTAIIPHDGERNDRSSGYEIVHYMPGECSEFMQFIALHKNEDIRLRFNGENGRTTDISLDSSTRRALSAIYDAAQTVALQRRLTNEGRRLEQQLRISRDHAAKTFEAEEKGGEQ